MIALQETALWHGICFLAASMQTLPCLATCTSQHPKERERERKTCFVNYATLHKSLTRIICNGCARAAFPPSKTHQQEHCAALTAAPHHAAWCLRHIVVSWSSLMAVGGPPHSSDLSSENPIKMRVLASVMMLDVCHNDCKMTPSML